MASRSFFGCYLLRSLDPVARAGSYIGFTVNPRRRIRQHNGEISSGAWRTRRGRPWEMVLVVYGFPTQVQALQFEWAWQHPDKSKVVRTVVAQLKASQRKGLKGKVHILMGMLGAAPWKYYPLTLQILSEQHTALLKGCAPCPPHMPIVVAPMDQLPQPGKQQQQEEEDEEQQQQQQRQDSGDVGSKTAGSCSDDEQPTCSQLVAVPGDAAQQRRRRRRQQQQGQDCSLQALDADYCSSGSSDVVVVSDSSDEEDSILQQASQLLPLSAAASAAAGAAAVSEVPLVVSKRRGKGSKQTAAAAAKAAEGPRCGVCHKAMERFVLTCPHCNTEYHTDCLATALLQQQQQQQQQVQQQDQLGSMPNMGQCLSCKGQLVWQDLLAAMKPFGAGAPAGSQRQRQSRSRTKKKGSKARSRSSSRPKQQTADAAAGQRQGRKPKQKGTAATESAAADVPSISSQQRKSSSSSRPKAPRRAPSKAAKGKSGKAKGKNGTSGSTSDSSSDSSHGSDGSMSRSRRGHVVAAAAAVAASDGYAASLRNELPALSDLAEHLAQRYPDLVLPSDLQQLGALLLGQDTQPAYSSQAHLAAPKHQQQQEKQHWDDGQCIDQHQQQQQQQPAAGCVRQVQAGNNLDDWLKHQQYQQPHSDSHRDAITSRDLRSSAQPSHDNQLDELPMDNSAYVATTAAADVVDLCYGGRSPSPPPLLARLKLASPLGKRVRSTAAAAAVAHVAGSVVGCDSSSRVGSSSPGFLDSNSKQRAASRRLRLNGTTPLGMARPVGCSQSTAAEAPARVLLTLPVSSSCINLLDD